MANRYRNLIYSTAEYTHSYGGFKGIELNAGSLIKSTSRLAYAENMYKDYDGDGADVIESIPGFRAFANYGKTVHAIYYQRSPSGSEDHLIVHVEDKLMRHPVSDINRKNCVGTEIATVENKKSFGFEYGKFFYVMDTVSIFRIDENGECRKIGDDDATPYIPTTYVSGKEYEQRNLLTNAFKEEIYVADPSAHLYSTDGLKFTITDPHLRYCSVSGIKPDVAGDIYLPAYVKIADEEYKVISVADYAFTQNCAITSVFISHGITEIGKHAFSYCDSLATVVISPTVTKIKGSAFSICNNLKTFYLGAGVTEFEGNILLGTTSLTTINYALTAADFLEITNHERINVDNFIYNSTYDKIKISLRASDEIESISGISVEGRNLDYESLIENGKTVGAIFEFDSISDATGIKVMISGMLKESDENWMSDMTVLKSTTPYEAIVSCTVAEVFDGRIFFSGNPNYPNTVFYTQRTDSANDGKLYVGKYNYFNDGVGSYKVVSMLSVRDMLAIFKEGDDGSGSIFYHKKEGTGLDYIDTVYPVAYVHSEICSVGACLSFLDDPVFLTSEGLMALNSENINYQRNVVCRSHNVNYALLKSDLSKASLCEWLGYLVVGIGDTVLLADSRAIFTHPAGSREYEWFMLRDIGTYTGDATVYRYSYEKTPDTEIAPSLSGSVAPYEQVMSAKDTNGEIYYYVYDETVKYRVEPTEERSGGVFHPATTFISHGRLLFFATENGSLCVFNNDMRGVAPEGVKNSEEYNEEEYLITMGNKIHPLFYTFDTHAPKYIIKTASDNCGVPHLTKSTVKKSLVIKAKSYTPDAISCDVTTDERNAVHVGNFPMGDVGFDNMNFLNAPWYVTKYTTVSLSEKEKRWVEKQITLTAEEYASPIAVYSVSYRYVIKGKIKNN